MEPVNSNGLYYNPNELFPVELWQEIGKKYLSFGDRAALLAVNTEFYKGLKDEFSKFNQDPTTYFNFAHQILSPFTAHYIINNPNVESMKRRIEKAAQNLVSTFERTYQTVQDRIKENRKKHSEEMQTYTLLCTKMQPVIEQLKTESKLLKKLNLVQDFIKENDSIADGNFYRPFLIEAIVPTKLFRRATKETQFGTQRSLDWAGWILNRYPDCISTNEIKRLLNKYLRDSTYLKQNSQGESKIKTPVKDYFFRNYLVNNWIRRLEGSKPLTTASAGQDYYKLFKNVIIAGDCILYNRAVRLLSTHNQDVSELITLTQGSPFLSAAIKTGSYLLTSMLVVYKNKNQVLPKGVLKLAFEYQQKFPIPVHIDYYKLLESFQECQGGKLLSRKDIDSIGKEKENSSRNRRRFRSHNPQTRYSWAPIPSFPEVEYFIDSTKPFDRLPALRRQVPVVLGQIGDNDRAASEIYQSVLNALKREDIRSSIMKVNNLLFLAMVYLISAKAESQIQQLIRELKAKGLDFGLSNPLIEIANDQGLGQQTIEIIQSCIVDNEENEMQVEEGESENGEPEKR